MPDHNKDKPLYLDKGHCNSHVTGTKVTTQATSHTLSNLEGLQTNLFTFSPPQLEKPAQPYRESEITTVCGERDPRANSLITSH